MYFFFKRKKIVLDCFTCDPKTFSYFPIQHMQKFFPDWWKNTNPYYTVKDEFELEIKTSTIKKCNGIIDLYKTGFALPLWSDLILETKSDGIYSYRFASGEQEIANHPKEQFLTLCDRYIHMKISSPWYFKEKSGIKFLWNSPKWNHLNNDLNIINILPGCVEYKDQISTNINIFLPKADNKFFVSHNTPMIHIIPITENDVEIKNHLISKTEWEHMLDLNKTISFNNNYNNRVKLRKSKEKSKCPFGF
jgi:hypothetical protein